MADNVPITTGNGATVATDDVGGVHYQIVKLSTGPLDSAGSPVSNSNPLAICGGRTTSESYVSTYTGVSVVGVRNESGTVFGTANNSYIPIAVNDMGYVYATTRYDIQRLIVFPTGLTTSVTAYSAGDVVGGVMAISGAARTTGGAGMIRSVVLTDAADIIGAYDVVYSRNTIPSMASDNAAFNIATDADANSIIGIVQLAGSFDLGGNRIAQATNLAIPYDCSGSTTLYATLLCRVGHTFFAGQGNLQLTTYVERY